MSKKLVDRFQDHKSEVVLNKEKSEWDETLSELSTPQDENSSAQATLEKDRSFTLSEMGAPDSDDEDVDSPASRRSLNKGPMGEEGEGDRQNDQLAELSDTINSKSDLDQRR